MNSLEQLKQITTVVADTGDLQAIARLKPVDATTNPSLITKALSHADMQPQLRAALARHSGDVDAVINDLTVDLGKQILALIKGRVSTEVDASLSYDTDATVRQASQFIDAYAKAGVDTSRILIKIAGTWQGIQAARQLEQQNIACNVTLIFGLAQAQACADADVTLISPFVGRILDWQKRAEHAEHIAIAQDKGVQSVKRIYHYFKQHGYPTQIMGASFRSVEQILALAGCDLLTISPELLDALASMQTPVVRQLSPDMTHEPITKTTLAQADFDTQLTHDAITHELLPAGIEGFVKARQQLVDLLNSLA